MQELTRESRTHLLETYGPPLLERLALDLNAKYFGFPGDLDLRVQIHDGLGGDSIAGRVLAFKETKLSALIAVGTPERLARLCPKFGYETALRRVLAHEMIHVKARFNGDLDPNSHYDNTFYEYSKIISKAEGWAWDYEKLPHWGLF